MYKLAWGLESAVFYMRCAAHQLMSYKYYFFFFSFIHFISFRSIGSVVPLCPAVSVRCVVCYAAVRFGRRRRSSDSRFTRVARVAAKTDLIGARALQAGAELKHGLVLIRPVVYAYAKNRTDLLTI